MMGKLLSVRALILLMRQSEVLEEKNQLINKKMENKII